MPKPSVYQTALGRASQLAGTIRGALRMDAWENTITGMGIPGMDKLLGNTVAINICSPDLLDNLFHADDIAARIVEAPVERALMQGIEIQEDPEGTLAKAVKTWDALGVLAKAAIWGRLYGAGAIMLGVKVGITSEALDHGEITAGSLLHLTVLERQHLQVHTRYTDPEAPKFGEAATYMVDRAGGEGVEVHETRLIVFGGVRTSEKFRQKNDGWDLSVLQRPYDILRDTNTAWQNFMHLLNETSQAVFKIKGLASMIANGQKGALMNRMEVVNMARSIARAVVVDADSEDFRHEGAANLGGVPPALVQVWQRLAASAKMPVTVLMGMSPAGMNATGESDTRSWFDTVATLRTDYLETPLGILLAVIARHEGITLGEEGVGILWPSLWQMTPPEEAAHKKTTAETAKLWVDMGVLLPEEVTIAVFGSGRFSSDLASAVDVEPRQVVLDDELADLLDPPPPPAMIPGVAPATPEEAPAPPPPGPSALEEE